MLRFWVQQGKENFHTQAKSRYQNTKEAVEQVYSLRSHITTLLCRMST
jgi:hypothetical protein